MITDKTSCARTACDKPARFGVDVYCSDDCRLIHTHVKALPTTGSGGSMHQTRGAAVGFAFGWLDARSRETESFDWSRDEPDMAMHSPYGPDHHALGLSCPICEAA